MNVEQEIQALKQVNELLLRSMVQSGTVLLFAGVKAPNDEWLLCDGSAISRVGFASLFKVIGETYGSGDGSTTFNLPDLRGRTAIGAGQADGLSDRIIGQAIGEESHTLSISEMPQHAHSGRTDTAGNHTHDGISATANPKFYRSVHESTDTRSAANHQKGWKSGEYKDRTDAEFSNADHTHNFSTNQSGDHQHTLSLAPEGGNQPHSIIQPSLVLTYVIKT